MRKLFPFLLAGLIVCLPAFCHAQKGAKFWIEGGSKQLLENAAKNAARDAVGRDILEQNVSRYIIDSQLAKQSAVYSVLRMEPANFNIPEKSKHLFQANAFLVEVNYKGKKEIWGVSAGELIDGFGKELTLKVKVNGKEVKIPATVVQKGPHALSNIALLRVPQKLPAGLKPLQISAQYSKGEPVAIYGYERGGWFELPSLTLQKDNGLFLRMDFSKVKDLSMGALGAPVLTTKGNLIGVFCNASWTGGHASTIRMLPKMVAAAHGEKAEFPLQMNNIFFGNIRLTEVILSIETLDDSGAVIDRFLQPREIHQSTLLNILSKKKVRFMRFLLEDRHGEPYVIPSGRNSRWLLYDKVTNRHFFLED